MQGPDREGEAAEARLEALPEVRGWFERVEARLAELPPDEAAALVDDLYAHLEARVERRIVRDGFEGAVEGALSDLGDADVVADALLSAHLESANDRAVSATIGWDRVLALAWLGLPATLCLAYLALTAYLPERTPLPRGLAALGSVPWEPAVRFIAGDRLPEGYAYLAFTLLAPWIGGWGLARGVPVRPWSLAATGLLLPLIVTAFLALVALPMPSVRVLALALPLYWLPTASLSAFLTWSRYTSRRRTTA